MSEFKIKAIIFDLDGTLGDTLPLCILSFQETLELITGKSFSEEEITSHFGKTEEGIFQSLIPEIWEQGFRKYLEIYAQNHHICANTFDGVIDMLDYLKARNIKLAMVTGKGRMSADITLKHFKIDKYFEYVETGSTNGSIKPECMKNILSKWEIESKSALYIGDSPDDILDSRIAGVIPVSVTWSSTCKIDQVRELKPEFLFDRIEDFHSWVKTL